MDSGQSDELVAALRHAVRGLVARRDTDDLEQILRQIVASAVDTVSGADAGGVTMIDNGRITSRSPSNEDVHELDELQAEFNQGPCVSAALEPAADGVIVACDLAESPDADRWPRFAARAVERGYRSMMSTQLSFGSGPRAALNLYSHSPAAFDDSARTVAGLFGLQAGLLLHGVNHAVQLGRAMDTRDLIGQAKGILVERYGVDGDQAFEMLVRSSQDTNIKLAEVARWLVTDARITRGRAGGQLPDPPIGAPS